MNNEIITLEGINYKRVNKTIARNAFNNGVSVGFCPVKVNPLSPWGFIVFRNNEDNLQFDNFLNHFEYYNCQYNELGKYTKFYIEA